ncbi:formylmethanofuran dehydrogenase subunit E family protein [Candidatus Bipolaricaulota bacterium]|nr:formylmethanofuran dehydrogenase subunit E family protein [Candidatus Bipolaricaulota bacterium]
MDKDIDIDVETNVELDTDPQFVEHDANLDVLIERGVALHGHLGPYLVCGIRMGRLALQLLRCRGYSDISAESDAGSTPPLSCLTDGIQVGCGCTTGKGNLRVTNWCRPRVWFIGPEGRTVTIEIRPEVVASFRTGTLEQASQSVKTLPLEELFQWNPPSD